MPVHVENMTSDVTVLEGDLPLTHAQLDRLVRLVLRRLDDKHREAAQIRDATALRQSAAPPLRIGD